MSLKGLRGALSLVLALTLALPAYTCDGYRGPDGEVVNSIPSGADRATYVATEVPHRPLEDFEVAGMVSWLTLVAYTWPLLLLVVMKWRPAFNERGAAGLLTIILSALSAWWVFNVVVSGDIAYGAVLSLATLAALTGVGLAELLSRRRAPRLSTVGG